MDSKFEKINEVIDKNAARLDESGAVSVFLEGKPALRKFFGKADRESGEAVTENTRYLLSLDSWFFAGLCVLVLADMKKLSFSDKLSRFIPEYKYADEIAVSLLLTEKSGVRDFLYGELQPKIAADPEYGALSDEGRRARDSEILLRRHSFDEVMELIGEKELEFKPNLRRDYSETNRIFLREIVERASVMSINEFAEEHIFKKLGMNETRFGAEGAAPLYALFRNKTYLRLDADSQNPCLFTSTVSDLEKLMLGIFEHRLFSKKIWKAATKFDHEGEGLIFVDRNGTTLADAEAGIQSLSFSFDEGARLCYLTVTNADSKYDMEGEEYIYFRRELRYAMEGEFTYPKNTRMVPYGPKNWRGASDLKVRPDQLEFVCSAKDTIVVYAALKKEEHLFVEMEGNRAVGLLDLRVNKKEDVYHIAIVLIDQRYQHRGFGKVMLRFAVDYLKKAGAKKLSIGVNRYNIPAQKLYKSVGFHEDSIYDEFIYMTQDLTD